MGHLRVRINEGLLINTPDTFQVAHVERVLRIQIPRMSGFDFATGLVITGFTLQRFQTFFEILKVVAQPDRTTPLPEIKTPCLRSSLLI